jgi:hypothetical protein
VHELNKTQAKLLSTPTAGVASEHSAYYRRLLSAGYKGHNQGLIGGATLYGTLGLVIGTLVGIPLAIATSAFGALLIIPVITAAGAAHGAHTFSQIGTQAAISAEAAETNETRRLLLDQLADSTNPEEKKAIQHQLDKQLAAKPLTKFFHWKTLLIGAAIGGAVALAAALLVPYLGAAALPEGLLHIAEGMEYISPIVADAGHAAVTTAASPVSHAAKMSITATGASVLTAIGALSGAILGIDREYVRRWLDGAEIAVNDPKHVQHEMTTRAQEVTSIGKSTANEITAAETPKTSDKNPLISAASLKNPTDKPTNTISETTNHAALTQRQQSLSA